eukprot:463642-Prymnesium_polylepis.1
MAELFELCGAFSDFIASLAFFTTPFRSTILPDVLFAAHAPHMGSHVAHSAGLGTGVLHFQTPLDLIETRLWVTQCQAVPD